MSKIANASPTDSSISPLSARFSARQGLCTLPVNAFAQSLKAADFSSTYTFGSYWAGLRSRPDRRD